MAMPETTFGGGGFSVLEDPTGRRARWMRRAGRVVFIVFLVWLLAIVLGGLGLAPVGGIPLTHALRPSTGPAPLAKLPQPRQPSASDLRPAAPATAVAASTGTAGQQVQSVPARQRGQSATAPGQTKTTTVNAARGHSAAAPGHQTTTTAAALRGRSSTAPGQTKTTTTVSHGRSTTAPGRTRTTTTTTTTTASHGQNSSTPGKQKH